MSNAETAIPLNKATEVGMSFMGDIGPSVSRVQLAGSVRRQRDYVHDIEIVAMPITAMVAVDANNVQGQSRLPLGDVQEVDYLEQRMRELLRNGTVTRDRPRKDKKSNPFGPRYYRISYIYDGVAYPVDLFAVKPPAQWGVVLLIRTGNAGFSHWFVQQGYRYGIRVIDGHLERNGTVIQTPEELDVFTSMHVPYRDPKLREIP